MKEGAATWTVWENYSSLSTSSENVEAKKSWEKEQEEMLGSLHASSSISCKPKALSKIFQSSKGKIQQNLWDDIYLEAFPNT